MLSYEYYIADGIAVSIQKAGDNAECVAAPFWCSHGRMRNDVMQKYKIHLQNSFE